MFDQALLLSNTDFRRPWTVLVSCFGQTVAIGMAILLPLVFTDNLPRTTWARIIYTAPVPPPPPPPAARIEPTMTAAVPSQISGAVLTTPSAFPAKPALIVDPPEAVPEPAGIGVFGGTGVPGGTHDGVLNRILNSIRSAAIAAPPPAVAAPAVRRDAAPAPPVRIKLGGLVQAAKILHQPIPVYPPLARQARIAGIVTLQGVIGTDGTIRELEVISGHPLLVKAAMDAVRKWVYRPTLLNGEPVEVIAPIQVVFSLSQ